MSKKLHFLIAFMEGAWVAMCMDLCLAAQCNTPSGAEAKLDEQILSYVEEALTLDGGKHENLLLNRPAPLTNRFMYGWRRLCEALGFPSAYAYTKVKLCTGDRLIDVTRAYMETR